jgi:transcriptional regulator with XRE-family HTH domain
MYLSDRLRTIIYDLNISQTKFATAPGVSFTYINCLINGRRGNISQSLALLIQLSFGYSVYWVLYGGSNIIKKNDTYFIVIKIPAISLHNSLIVLLAPHWTSVLWLIGIGLLGNQLFINIPYHYTEYIIISIIFAIIHSIHGYICYNIK